MMILSISKILTKILIVSATPMAEFDRGEPFTTKKGPRKRGNAHNHVMITTLAVLRDEVPADLQGRNHVVFLLAKPRAVGALSLHERKHSYREEVPRLRAEIPQDPGVPNLPDPAQPLLHRPVVAGEAA
jgi:hypothetical protein